jgi:uncharacterized protein (DUF2062 family)
MIRKTVPKIKAILRKALLDGITPKSLALSASVGVYIAFSPFPGAHTLMMLLAKWLLRLHFPTLFIMTSINNPWTMIPFFSLDYAFGHWLLHSVIGWSPTWTISLAKIFGSGTICLWSFFIGGNILGIVAGLLTYPVMLFVFNRMHARMLARGVDL